MASLTFDRFLQHLSLKVTTHFTLKALAPLLGQDDFLVDQIAHDTPAIRSATLTLLTDWKRAQVTDDDHDRVLIGRLRPAFADEMVKLGAEYDRVVSKLYPNYVPASTRGGGDGAHGSGAAPGSAPLPAGETSDHAPAPAASPARAEVGDGNKRAPKAVMDKVPWKVPSIPGRLDAYPIRKPLGKAVVINNEFYDDPELNRAGTHLDADRVVKILQKMGFELTDGGPLEGVDAPLFSGRAAAGDEPDRAGAIPAKSRDTDPGAPPVIKDMEDVKILKALDNVVKEVKETDSCFCCVILTHGHENQIKTVNNGKLGLLEIISKFKPKNCKALTGIPKLFFIQACQGSLDDIGQKPEGHDSDGPAQRIHNEADIFVFYAAPFGYRSYRHESVGSRFIQCLCSVLEEHHANRHLVEIATAVTCMVHDISKQVEEGPVQVPMMTSTLRKPFYFKAQ